MYGQLIGLLDKYEIFKFSRLHHGERYVKHFDAYQHLNVMLYAVTRRFDSLREITDSMFPETLKLAHPGISTMPDAAHCRMPTPAGLRRCLRTPTAAYMTTTGANFSRTAESGRFPHGSTVCK